MTDAERAIFHDAVNKWSKVLLAPPVIDLLPIDVPAGRCGKAQTEPIVNEFIPTLRVYVTFDSIDGRGGMLASAGPCKVWPDPGFGPGDPQRTLIGLIRLDRDDFRDPRFSHDWLVSVIVHEIGHILGIGTLWHPYVEGQLGPDPRYTGLHGARMWRALGGIGQGVEIENSLGPGTRDAHWRENVFQSEAMTGLLGAGHAPLSVITLGALADIGWFVDYGAADDYSIPQPYPPAMPSMLLEPLVGGKRFTDEVLLPQYESTGSGTRRIVQPD